jgi:hypothetical protein
MNLGRKTQSNEDRTFTAEVMKSTRLKLRIEINQPFVAFLCFVVRIHCR